MTRAKPDLPGRGPGRQALPTLPAAEAAEAAGAAALFAVARAPFETFLVGVLLHALSVPLGLAIYHVWATDKAGKAS